METAPPPIIAPPHVHAHNFARAILTDIIFTLTFVLCYEKFALLQYFAAFNMTKKTEKKVNYNAKALKLCGFIRKMTDEFWGLKLMCHFDT